MQEGTNGRGNVVETYVTNLDLALQFILDPHNS